MAVRASRSGGRRTPELAPVGPACAAGSPVDRADDLEESGRSESRSSRPGEEPSASELALASSDAPTLERESSDRPFS